MEETIFNLLNSHSILSFLGAFGAGSLTAIAPCSLMTIPLLVGSSVALNKDLEEKRKSYYIYTFSTLFALGVAISFSILGFIVAKFGGFFSIAPLWAYLLSAIFSIFIGLYAWGIFGEVNKTAMIQKLLPFRLFGGFLIGLVFGFISTPCASAPLIAIITVASSSGYIYAYSLIFTFALGHSLLLLVAGISVGFAQSIIASPLISKLSNFSNKSFAMMFIVFGNYFIYEAYLQF